ncbi:MAG: 4-(cytidine 5'-diphospho)-2-C-methyl-D-erythritol kinase, partial [Erythrobacter sp.]
LLDSFVAFADVGDTIWVRKSNATTINISGPMAQGVPADESNLAMMAARLLGVDVDITLEKCLPMAAGIGGGSSNAAAVINGIEQLNGQVFAGDTSVLGADVPMCKKGTAARVQSIGDHIETMALPRLFAVLVNPGVPVSTVSVFKALAQKSNPPMSELPQQAPSTQEFCAWLREQRNDLEAPAIALCPQINDVLRALSLTTGQLCYRMSGSGATCFALFDDPGLAELAALDLEKVHPEWWVRDCALS